jgi:hypothetical protein
MSVTRLPVAVTPAAPTPTAIRVAYQAVAVAVNLRQGVWPSSHNRNLSAVQPLHTLVEIHRGG